MEKQVLLDVLEKHLKWINGESGGERADLEGADLQDADLQDANLREADLWGAGLQNADLRGANLQHAGLRFADLRGANLEGTDLRFADLQNVDLQDADLCGTNLWATNLSGAKGIKLAADYIMENFEQTADGIIVYKTFGTFNNPNPNWEIKPGAVIEENVDFYRTNECGCGVNVGTLEWVRENSRKKPIWKCLIHWIDLADVVVPYNTDGKIRAGRVQLLEIVEEEA